jgi:hypothetical protein
MDTRDWAVIALLAGMHISATAFIFFHPDTANFVTWAGVTSTITCAYHWFVYKDSKVPDAGVSQAA